MTAARHGANTLTVGADKLLLTVTGGGQAVHLTGMASPPHAGRGAVHNFYFDSGHAPYAPAVHHYDPAALLKPCWVKMTLCGRVWAVMVGGDGGPLDSYGEVAFVPTCRSCLRLMDRHFPAPVVDDRVPIAAQLVADTVTEHGYAEVRHLPGDQQAALRKAVRRLIRQQTGFPSQTIFRSSTLFVICDAVYSQHASKFEQAATEAIAKALTSDGRPQPPPKPEWIISWDAWDLN